MSPVHKVMLEISQAGAHHLSLIGLLVAELRAIHCLETGRYKDSFLSAVFHGLLCE